MRAERCAESSANRLGESNGALTRNQETFWAVQREDGSWLLDGHVLVPELRDRLSLGAVHEEIAGATTH